MEEPKEESVFVGDCREPMEEAHKELGLSYKTETLSGEDATTVKASNSFVCDVNGEETKDDIGKTVSSDDVDSSDTVTEPETERNDIECFGDAGTDEVKPVDEKAVNDEKETNEVEDGEMFSVAENGADQEKVSTEKSEEDDNKIGVESQQEKEEKVTHSYNEQGDSGCETLISDQEKEVAKKSEEENSEMDVDNNQEKEESLVRNEQSNLGSEKVDGKHSESVIVPEESIHLSEGDMNEVIPGTVLELSSAAEIRHEEEITKVNQNEENVEDMEIDYAAEEQVKKDVKDAATGEVEPLDHNALFDPSSDITNFIDFSGVSSWSGNIQDLKTESGNVSLKEDKKATTLESNVSLHVEEIHNESSDACIPVRSESLAAAATERQTEGSDAIMGSDEQDRRREENDISHVVPSIDPNQKEDTEIEENRNNSDFADDEAGSDIKTNGMKLMEDVLSEGSDRKSVSFAKVLGVQRPSFKIGACIARAATQMAGSPSVVKDRNFGDETLRVESFVLQLHSAAVGPVTENVVSDVATDFFLEFRNSSASQQVTPEKVSNKRIKISNSNAEGTKTFEFEEMGDTYWTDRVIHNGSEEQTLPTDGGSYQIVPVELKPAQVQRTRRPYRRRQTQISIPHSVSEKLANIDKNAPAELIMNFSELDTIPPEKSLSKMLRHFGPIRESQTEVDMEKHRARVVFKKGADAEAAYSSVGSFKIFGTKSVKYELSYTITETFKVQPYVVSLGEEDATLCPPS